MTTTPPDQPGDAFGTPGMPGGPTDPGYGGMSSIPAPPGQWAGPPLAEWPLRLVSGLIDGGIPAVAYYVLALGVKSFFLGFIVATGINVYFQYLQGTTGQSPGKKVVNTKLLREADGQVLGFGNAFLRSILHIVDAAPCGLGYFWPIWDAKRQTFADKIVSSVVIRG